MTRPRTAGARDGRALSSEEKSALAPYIPQIDLERAILCDGHVPWYLPQSFVAIVRGHRIYVRAGVYRPGTAEGLALLGHELMHVQQYRTGMTAVSYLLSTLRGYANSRYERAAFGVQRRIAADLGVAPIGGAPDGVAPIDATVRSSRG